MNIIACHSRGFTLIELMIAITVAAILLGVGVPAYRDLVVDNRRAATINRLASSIHVARTEAYARNRPVRLCIANGNAPPDDCDPGGDWHGGWIAFVDDNGNDDTAEPSDDNGQHDSGEEILLLEGAAPEPVSLTANHQSLRFTRNRQPTQATFLICADSSGRKLVVGPTGHPRLEDGSC